MSGEAAPGDAAEAACSRIGERAGPMKLKKLVWHRLSEVAVSW